MVDRKPEARELMGGDYQVLYSGDILSAEEKESSSFKHKTVVLVMPAQGASGLDPYTITEIAGRHFLANEATTTRTAEAMRSMSINFDGPYTREQQLTETLAFWNGPESKPSLMPASIAPSAETSDLLVIGEPFDQIFGTLSAHRQNLLKINEKSTSASAVTLSLLEQFEVRVDKQGFDRARILQSNITLAHVVATEDLIKHVIAASTQENRPMYEFVESHANSASARARLNGRLSPYDTAGIIKQPDKKIALTRGGPNHITLARAMSSLPQEIRSSCDLDKLVDVVATEQQLATVASIACPRPGAFMTNNQTVIYDVALPANLSDIQEIPARFPSAFPRTHALINKLGIKNGRR